MNTNSHELGLRGRVHLSDLAGEPSPPRSSLAHFALDRKRSGIEFPGEAAPAPVLALALPVTESLFQLVAHGAAVHELDVSPSL